MKYINIINFVIISVVLALAIEAYPQRGPRRGGCGLIGRKSLLRISEFVLNEKFQRNT